LVRFRMESCCRNARFSKAKLHRLLRDLLQKIYWPHSIVVAK
jgi:hypothetical protein